MRSTTFWQACFLLYQPVALGARARRQMASRSVETPADDSFLEEQQLEVESSKEGQCKDYGCGGFVRHRPCQCNSHCVRYHSCCSDYDEVCNGGKKTITTTTTTTTVAGMCTGKWCQCPYVLARPSDEEENLLIKMLEVQNKSLLGKGADVRKRDADRGPYSDLVFRSAWKVSSSPALDAYHENVAKLDAEKDHHEFPFATDGTAVKVGLNEYLLWHGGGEDHLQYKVCKGGFPGDGVFGNGIYLADVPDKMDQYANDQVENTWSNISLDYYRDLLKNANLEDEKLTSPQYLFGLVVRTYLGHYAELQRDSWGHSNWYWKDPEPRDTHSTDWKDMLDLAAWRSGGVIKRHQHGAESPFPSESTKAVAKSGNAQSRRRLGGEKPNWYNEYMVPDPGKVAVQYIVLYERQYQ